MESGIESISRLGQCPLCKSDMKLFSINLEEDVYLCGEENCVYPFGYEDFKFVPHNSEESLKLSYLNTTQEENLISLEEIFNNEVLPYSNVYNEKEEQNCDSDYTNLLDLLECNSESANGENSSQCIGLVPVKLPDVYEELIEKTVEQFVSPDNDQNKDSDSNDRPVTTGFGKLTEDRIRKNIKILSSHPRTSSWMNNNLFHNVQL